MAENNTIPETPAMEAQPITPVESSPTPTVTPEATTATAVKKSGNNKVLWIILGILAFLVICCLAVFGILWATGASFVNNLFGTVSRLEGFDDITINSEEFQNTDTESTPDGDEDTSDDEYDFGDLFSDGNFAVSVEDVRKDGSNYVITMDVKNQGTKPMTFSSLLYISLEDENGEVYSQNFFYDIPQNQRLDLELEAGQTFRGRIAFQVQGNPQSLTLLVRDSLFDETPTEFKIK